MNASVVLSEQIYYKSLTRYSVHYGGSVMSDNKRKKMIKYLSGIAMAMGNSYCRKQKKKITCELNLL